MVILESKSTSGLGHLWTVCDFIWRYHALVKPFHYFCGHAFLKVSEIVILHEENRLVKLALAILIQDVAVLVSLA